METDQAENIPPHSSSFFDQTIPPIYDSKGESSSDNEGDKLFKPLNFDSNQPASFTGQTFLESFMKMSSQTPTPNTNNLTENLAESNLTGGKSYKKLSVLIFLFQNLLKPNQVSSEASLRVVEAKTSNNLNRFTQVWLLTFMRHHPRRHRMRQPVRLIETLVLSHSM